MTLDQYNTTVYRIRCDGCGRVSPPIPDTTPTSRPEEWAEEHAWDYQENEPGEDLHDDFCPECQDDLEG